MRRPVSCRKAVLQHSGKAGQASSRSSARSQSDCHARSASIASLAIDARGGVGRDVGRDDGRAAEARGSPRRRPSSRRSAPPRAGGRRGRRRGSPAASRTPAALGGAPRPGPVERGDRVVRARPAHASAKRWAHAGSHPVDAAQQARPRSHHLVAAGRRPRRRARPPTARPAATTAGRRRGTRARRRGRPLRRRGGDPPAGRAARERPRVAAERPRGRPRRGTCRRSRPALLRTVAEAPTSACSVSAGGGRRRVRDRGGRGLDLAEVSRHQSHIARCSSTSSSVASGSAPSR